jgi:Arc/MetJ family transcription regulator
MLEVLLRLTIHIDEDCRAQSLQTAAFTSRT